VRFVATGPALVAFVTGDVDELTARAIGSSLLAETRRNRCGGLVIDLRNVTFLGSTGLSMLLDVRRNLLDREVETLLLCQSESMPQRVLRITKLDDLFAVHTALGDALHALDGDGDMANRCE